MFLLLLIFDTPLFKIQFDMPEKCVIISYIILNVRLICK